MDQMEKFKVKPYNHQLVCLNEYGRREAFALLAEMGTGKTFIIINNIADLWSSHDLDAVLILAPNGVHYNWTMQEIPKHMPDYVRCRVAAYSSGMTKKEQRVVDSIITADSTELRILTMNWEALTSKTGFEAAKKFCNTSRRLMIVCDESQNIKNPQAQRTKQLMKLKPQAHYRRIMSGTAIVNSPFDAFSQFAFLDEEILQTSSYFAFKAEYAEMLPPTHGLLQRIVAKKAAMKSAEKAELWEDYKLLKTAIIKNGKHDQIEVLGKIDSSMENEDYDLLPMEQDELRSLFSPAPSSGKTLVLQIMARIDARVAAHLRALSNAMNPHRLPQIVDKDKAGRPIYRNLEKLNKLIAPHTFRVMKKDCLDLPKKIYKSAYFDMTPQQRSIYNKVEEECRLVFEGRETPIAKLTVTMKLAQITSGYFLHPEAEEPVRIEGENPKLQLLKERVLEAVENGLKVIVWARFRVQIEDIVKTLKAEGIEVVQYHGGVRKNERLENLDAFREGAAQVFVGNQKAGGTGITIVESHFVIYFSNDFNAGDRWQSEDRAHRIGQEEDVLYYDLIARGTIDETIVHALVNKKDIAEEILAFGEKLADNSVAV